MSIKRKLNHLLSLFLTFMTETISRTDEGQPKAKYIFNKCGTSIFLLYRGLVHHHHRILNDKFVSFSIPDFESKENVHITNKKGFN